MMRLKCPQIRSFYRFLVYFTAGRILFQIGGIQSIEAMPGDPTINPVKNSYDIASYRKLCGEFGVSPNTDFRFKLDTILRAWEALSSTLAIGDRLNRHSVPGGAKFSDEDGTADDGNLSIQWVQNIEGADRQLEHFLPKKSGGLT